MAVFAPARMPFVCAGPFMPEEDQPALIRLWIKQAKAGDMAAFERLLRAHERLVLRTAQRLLANDEDAKDAAQEVFFRFHKTLGKFQEERELIPWLYRVTVNICLDTLRSTSTVTSECCEPVDSRSNPEESLSISQQKALLHAALANLSSKERAAIVLRDLEGRSTAETAHILRSTEATVRSQISTGRLKIKKFFAAKIRRPK